jgi:hypothetical protein
MDREAATVVAVEEIQEMTETLVDKAILVTLVVPEGIPEIPADKTIRQAIPVTLPALMTAILGDQWVDKAPLQDVPAQT